MVSPYAQMMIESELFANYELGFQLDEREVLKLVKQSLTVH